MCRHSLTGCYSQLHRLSQTSLRPSTQTFEELELLLNSSSEMSNSSLEPSSQSVRQAVIEQRPVRRRGLGDLKSASPNPSFHFLNLFLID